MASLRVAAETELLQDILRDNQITSTEYRDLTDYVIDCAAESGASLHTENRWGVDVFFSTEPDAGAALDECEAGEIAAARALYEDMRMDPEGRGEIVHLECLQRSRLFDAEVRSAREDRVPWDTFLDTLLDDALTSAERRQLERCMYQPSPVE